MFEDAEATLEQILKLVEKCPAALQGQCFEILLKAYVSSLASRNAPPATPAAPLQPPIGTTPASTTTTQVPEATRGRFAAASARLKVPQDKLATLFDFQQDPFTYHGLAVPGESKGQKTRNVALLLAFKSYLSSGSWSADWKEFRAMCVDQSCYDRTNIPKYMDSKEQYFKTASAGDGIALSSAGVAAAETLVTSIVSPGVGNNGSVE